ncbi:MAG: VOC family protein [Gemmatimonadetes bacterium]|nr:VOC family protein [Gemmatimonadota bacterium]
MIELRPRETVILAADFDALVAWYRDVLGFAVTKQFEGEFHYCNLATASGIRIGIGSAEEMGVKPRDRADRTVIMQFEVDDVKSLFEHVERAGGTIVDGPKLDRKDNFWFGSCADPEGNPFWVVDRNCP